VTGEGMEITLRDVYDTAQQTATAVAAVAGQVAQLQTTVHMQLTSGQKKMDDHEERIRTVEQSPKVSPADFGELKGRVGALERFRWTLLGGAATAAALVGALASIITAIIEKAK
jgi:hypothetical protein